MYDGLADIALQTGQIEAAERLYKETMKGCLSQVLNRSLPHEIQELLLE